MSTPAIRIEDVSKIYSLGLVSTRTLAHDLNRWWFRVRGKEDPYLKIGQRNRRVEKGVSELVWALRDITFDVAEGEILGIIGENGAGKSTLLKILSRVTSPTLGTVRMRGRVGSLLEVGTGFHPELTGRENIFLNGAILGMSKTDISSHLDEIIEFSGCALYIDTPVKRYSSGMYVRLAFAVAAHLEPDIMIVDEVLAVGDLAFQQKCLGKMKDVSQGGRTVLFVSHNMAAIGSLCPTSVLLREGSIRFMGATDRAIALYQNQDAQCSSTYVRDDSHPLNSELGIMQSSIMADKENRGYFLHGEDCMLEIVIRVSKPISSAALAIEVHNSEYGVLFASSSLDSRPSMDLGSYSAAGTYTARVSIPTRYLRSGTYYVNIAAAVPAVRYLDAVPIPLAFQVVDQSSPLAILGEGRRGAVLVRCHWEVERAE